MESDRKENRVGEIENSGDCAEIEMNPFYQIEENIVKVSDLLE